MACFPNICIIQNGTNEMNDNNTADHRTRCSNLRAGTAGIALTIGSYLLFLAILELIGGRPADLSGVLFGPSPVILTVASLPFLGLFAHLVYRDGTVR